MPLDHSLLRRVVVTLATVAAYRLAAHLPLSGVDVDLLARMSSINTSAITATSIIAIGVLPLVTALALIETARLVFPGLMRWQAMAPENAARLSRLGIALALAFALMQAIGLTLALEDIGGLVMEPGASFRMVSTITLVSGSVLAIALASIIDREGLGFGVWFLFLTPTLIDLPGAFAAQINSALAGFYPTSALLAGLAFVVLAAGAIVALLLSDRATRETVRMCIWMPLLAGIWLPYGLLALSWLTNGGNTDAASFAAPTNWQIIAMTFLTLALIVAGYTRSLARTGTTVAIPPVAVGLVVFAILGGGLALQHFGIALPFDRSPLVITVTIASVVAIASGLADRARRWVTD